MTTFTRALSKIGKKRIMVIGDFMLDAYTMGKVQRISPEAPVAVVHVQREEDRPGGAGNVALNLISLGAEVITVGRIGEDSHGAILRKALAAEGIHTEGLMVQKEYMTPVKKRILADHQQIVRIDYETITPIPELLEQKVLEAFPGWLEGIDLIAISDYGKGFLSSTLLNSVIEMARKKAIPVITDPKGFDFSKYRGTTVIKPNLKEAYQATNLSFDIPLEQVAQRLLESVDAEMAMITRSESGISLFFRDGSHQHFPAKVREIKDVTGAGDTVLAMLACAMANRIEMPAAAQLCNLAAGIAVEHFGCARVTLAQLIRKSLRENVSTKVFDEDHLFALEKALHGQLFTLLSVNSKEGLNSAIFQGIRQAAANSNHDLMVYVRDADPDLEFVNILASLNEVDFITLDENGLRTLCQVHSPAQILAVDKGVCCPVDTFKDLFSIGLDLGKKEILCHNIL